VGNGKEVRLKKGFFVTTMGCQMNEYDSRYLAETLLEMGYAQVDRPEDASVVLINTCSVRAKADQKAFSLVGRMSRLKKKRRDLILAVVGCVAQKEGYSLIRRFPQVDLVMGPREIGGFPSFLKRIERNHEKIVANHLDSTAPRPHRGQGSHAGKVTSCISIMQGCNNFCSYCIVPFVRGREVSRPREEILHEARRLVSQGVREITLLGQNVNSYRWEGTRGSDFASLLREMSKLKGLLRLRFTTSHPKDLSPELIRCFDELECLCPHLHLPVQAGSNRILRAMRRGYTRESYLELIEKLRRVRPDVAITSDVMVGFPGESEHDFELTLDLVKGIEFDALFSFKYSDREGTLAEKMEGKTEESVKEARLGSLQSLQKQITLKKNRLLEGSTVDVLVEGQSKKGGQLSGRTGTNKVVNFLCNGNHLGDIVSLKIRRGYVNSLCGEI
jgi:tRNA-2-methylthio-N6-dimethylallyladenosine synthase